MAWIETELSGVHLGEPARFEDERGFFFVAWSRAELEKLSLGKPFVQGNVAFNHKKGTLRGLHFQREPFAEVKLVRCTRGSIFDVAVDLRPGSPTLGRWVGIELSAANGRSMLLGEGFAHGYQTLEDDCEVVYEVTAPYAPSHAGGARWNDPAFGIRWPLPPTSIIGRDATYPDVQLEALRGRG